MNLLDYAVLFGTLLGIAAYGLWRTRGGSLEHYLRGREDTRWMTIGLSVMATQASAITFLSMPGQAYESGIGFVQNYFGLPLALIIVAAVFVPIYRRLKVYTAYEYLGKRFDSKTRLLGAGLFLLQRGLGAGITIYAPAIVLSTVMGWRLDATIIASGLVVIAYTVSGGSQAVNLTQKYQIGVIFAGMALAFFILVGKLPPQLNLNDVFTLAGDFGKLEAVDFSLDMDKRYTFWSGILGGLFLSLSYFGTDQSQVQRYLSGSSVRASRLGLMFNAVMKIPMQFFILLLGALIFVFYQFDRPPVFFNEVAWSHELQTHDKGGELKNFEREYDAAHTEKQKHLHAWVEARRAGNAEAEEAERTSMLAVHTHSEKIRGEVRTHLAEVNPDISVKDSDYVFIKFILDQLPHGVIGLLITVFFAATLSSKAGELNALGSTTTVDLYRHLRKKAADDAHDVRVSKWFTALWGFVALGFALFANLAENLIEAVNILGSIFYGVVLGLFLVAFFLKRVGGTAVFWAAIAAQALVFVLYASLSISYLWYNLIGCAACIFFALILQTALTSLGYRNPAPESP